MSAHGESVRLSRVIRGDRAKMPLGVEPTVADALASPGEELLSGEKSAMRARLGHDIGNVRVHRGDVATAAARVLDASAFAVGRDVVMGDGYTPGTRAGRNMLAHELVHMIQHGISTKDSGWVPRVSREDDPAERKAGVVAQAATQPAGQAHHRTIHHICHD